MLSAGTSLGSGPGRAEVAGRRTALNLMRGPAPGFVKIDLLGMLVATHSCWVAACCYSGMVVCVHACWCSACVWSCHF